MDSLSSIFGSLPLSSCHYLIRCALLSSKAELKYSWYKFNPSNLPCPKLSKLFQSFIYSHFFDPRLLNLLYTFSQSFVCHLILFFSLILGLSICIPLALILSKQNFFTMAASFFNHELMLLEDLSQLSSKEIYNSIVSKCGVILTGWGN